MKLSRIDQIALNGATGEHYKYIDIAAQLTEILPYHYNQDYDRDWVVREMVKILVENFPDDAT